MIGSDLPVAEPYVAGSWGGGAAVQEIRDPGRTDAVIGQVRYSTPQQVEHAYAAAEKVRRRWAQTEAAQRAAVLFAAADRLDADADASARDLVREEGKIFADALGEIHRSASTLRYYAGSALRPLGSVYPPERARLSMTRRHPVGVSTVITPFNYPMLLPAWKVGAALAHGNVVVWKCSELVPLSAARLARAFAEAGLPDGALNLVIGGSELSEALLDNPIRSAVTFTGSTAVGELISRRLGGTGTRVQLELGGRNPAVVLADADPDVAADLLVNGATSGSGQKCTSIALGIVEAERYAEVRDAVADRISRLVVGHGLDAGTQVGPVVSEAAKRRLAAAADSAGSSGARVIGRPDSALPDGGHYVGPTLLEDVPADSPLAREEMFGPFLILLPARDAHEAVRIANDTRFGLNAAVITRDLTRALAVADELDAGMVHVNAVSGFPPHIPFGGVKASGFGPLEQGDLTAEFFTEARVLNIHTFPGAAQ